MDMKKTIDDRLIAMEKVVSTRQLSPLQEEEIIQESVDRTLRIGNILLANVPEVKDVLDEEVANDILELIEPAALESLEKVSRIGRKIKGRPRLLRLKFKNPDMAREKANVENFQI